MTRKITRAAANIKLGKQKKLYLGNLDAERDWGAAKDFVAAMWRILQADAPDDYVIATGQPHTVKDFLAAAFEHVGLDWTEFVEVDPRYFRPTEVHKLTGDSTKIREKLNWAPTHDFKQLVASMVDYDLAQASNS